LHILGKFKAKGKAGMKKGRVMRPCGRLDFQAETFAKPTTDGASAARRHHLARPQSLPFGNEPSPFHFGFQAAYTAPARQ